MINPELRDAIFSHYTSVSELCRSHSELRHKGTIIGKLLNLQICPFKKQYDSASKQSYYSCEYRTVCLALESALNTSVEELFPKALYTDWIDGIDLSIEVFTFTGLSSDVKQQIKHLPSPPDDDPELRVDHSELCEKIHSILATLNPKEREIIEMRYGLNGKYSYTLKEIATIFNVTKQRIHTIEVRAIKNLRQRSRSRQLVSFL